jgi:hypothetical protein
LPWSAAAPAYQNTQTFNYVAHLRLTETNGAGLSSTSDTAITINPK